ncbi:MAG: Uma2 family endonuclease [Gemmatimonadota bacterium]
MHTYRAQPPEDRLTIEEFERLPEDAWRTELVRGRVVREPPAGFEHGRRAVRIASPIDAYVREHELGVVLAAETGFVLAEDPPTVRAPDVAFVAADRVPEGEDAQSFARLAPDLAVEVVSPSNTMSQLYAKVTDYLDAGTRLVWLADSSNRIVTVLDAAGRVRLLRAGETLDGGDVLPGFRLAVGDIFEQR